MRGVPTTIGLVLEVALAYAKSELDLSSQISLPLMLVLAVIAALIEVIVKSRPSIKIKGDKNVIEGNVAETADVTIEGSENRITSSSIPSSVWPIFVSLFVFLVIAILMVLLHLGATWGFGQLIK